MRREERREGGEGKGKRQVDGVKRRGRKRRYVPTSLPTIEACNDVIRFRLRFLLSSHKDKNKTKTN